MNPEATNKSTTAVPVTGILGLHGMTTTSTTTTTTTTDEKTTLSTTSSLISEEILLPFSDTNSSFTAEVDISENLTSIFTNSTTPVTTTTTSTTVVVPTGCMGHCKILYMKSSDYRKRYDENLIDINNPNKTLQTTTRG